MRRLIRQAQIDKVKEYLGKSSKEAWLKHLFSSVKIPHQNIDWQDPDSGKRLLFKYQDIKPSQFNAHHWNLALMEIFQSLNHDDLFTIFALVFPNTKDNVENIEVGASSIIVTLQSNKEPEPKQKNIKDLIKQFF